MSPGVVSCQATLRLPTLSLVMAVLAEARVLQMFCPYIGQSPPSIAQSSGRWMAPESSTMAAGVLLLQPSNPTRPSAAPAARAPCKLDTIFARNSVVMILSKKGKPLDLVDERPRCGHPRPAVRTVSHRRRDDETCVFRRP